MVRQAIAADPLGPAPSRTNAPLQIFLLLALHHRLLINRICRICYVYHSLSTYGSTLYVLNMSPWKQGLEFNPLPANDLRILNPSIPGHFGHPFCAILIPNTILALRT
jgi:hypothetical protein